MVRILGAVLVLTGCTAMGHLAGVRLKEKVRGLRALISALEVMEREMRFHLMPMEELLEQAAKAAQPPAKEFFLRCRSGLDRLGERSLAELWEDELYLLRELGEPAQAALRELGLMLGRFDGRSQLEGLAAARDTLGRCLKEALEEQTRMGRVYTTLGLSGGTLLAILLI